MDGLQITFLAKCLENSPQQSDFRYVTWGATKEQVKRAEAGTGPIWYEDEDVVSYEATFDSKHAIVTFFFEKDHLNEALYALDGASDDVSVHSRTKAFLTTLLGEPVETSEFWTDESLRGSLNKNTAIRLGKLHLFAMWKTSRSKINIRCWKAENSSVRHAIHFCSAIIAHN